MSKTHTLTTECYLYSFIDINSTDADKENPPTELAIDKTIAMFHSYNPTVIKLGDKLIVHGTQIQETHLQELSKSLYFTGQTVIYKSGWNTGNGYFFIGVNSEGDSILAIPKSKDPNTITTFKLPLRFDWSLYGVRVPDAVSKEREMEEMNQQLSKLKQELQEKNEMMGKMEAEEKDLENKLAGSCKEYHQSMKSEFEQVNQKLDKLFSVSYNGSDQSWGYGAGQVQPPMAVIESRRCRLAPERFSMSSKPLSMQPQLRVSMPSLRVFTACDDNVEVGAIKEKEICVYTGDKRFHSKEWWVIKAVEHKKITMVGFYDGEFDQVSTQGNYVNIPFRPEAASFSSNTQFFVGLIYGVGLRFMFLY